MSAIKIKYKVQYLQLIFLQSSQRILYLFPIVQFEIISLSQLLSHLLFSTLQTFYTKTKTKAEEKSLAFRLLWKQSNIFHEKQTID